MVDNSGVLTDILSARQQIVQQAEDIRFNSDVMPSSTISQAGSFANCLENALDYIDNRQDEASRLAIAYEKGEAVDITQLMLTRNEASLALEATLQVKNKILSAYQEFMRMGV